MRIRKNLMLISYVKLDDLIRYYIMQYFSRKDPIATRLPIFLLILLLLVAFLLSFYYFHDWKWGKDYMVEYQYTL